MRFIDEKRHTVRNITFCAFLCLFFDKELGRESAVDPDSKVHYGRDDYLYELWSLKIYLLPCLAGSSSPLADNVPLVGPAVCVLWIAETILGDLLYKVKVFSKTALGPPS